MATFHERNAVRVVATPGAWAAEAAYGAWIDIRGFQRLTFIPINGELDGNMTFAVYEATANDGTDAQAVTGLTGTFTNGTNEGDCGIIEVLSRDLSDGFPFVTLQVTPAAADTYSCIGILSDPDVAPVANAVANNVAFVDSIV